MKTQESLIKGYEMCLESLKEQGAGRIERGEIVDIELKIKLLKAGYQNAMNEIIGIIQTLKNPYPKDVFKWDNPEKLDFNRGRFNKHCHETWENCKLKLIKEIRK